MKKNKIPIILLHHEEFEFLLESIESIYKNTNYPFTLIIVDNKSKPNNLYWDSLRNKYPDIDIVFNEKNNWVYGFNLGIKKYQSDFYLLSDADIIFPKPVDNICWLEHLMLQMKNNQSIGKIGLALNLDLIKNIPTLKDLFDREFGYKSGAMIGANIVAPVDTTAALYRSDLFMNTNSKFEMRVGHFSNIKPHYYCVRTSDKYDAIHLGWKKYKAYQDDLNLDELIKKINFFARFGIKVENELLMKVGVFYRLKYKLTLKLMRLYYGISLIKNYFFFTISFKSKKYFRNLYDQ